MSKLSLADVAGLIRTVPDYPEPGVLFRDITPLLADGPGLRATVEALAGPWQDPAGDQLVIHKVAAIEARGFILGVPVALELGAGFVPVRKAGKLPGPTVSASYGLEYGTDTIEMHEDAVAPGDRVLILDDVLATGGTAQATADVIVSLGATVVGFSFLLELVALAGRTRLGEHRIESLLMVED
jgi:adenine phosphoribosyltransferase